MAAGEMKEDGFYLTNLSDALLNAQAVVAA